MNQSLHCLTCILNVSFSKHTPNYSNEWVVDLGENADEDTAQLLALKLQYEFSGQVSEMHNEMRLRLHLLSS